MNFWYLKHIYEMVQDNLGGFETQGRVRDIPRFLPLKHQ